MKVISKIALPISTLALVSSIGAQARAFPTPKFIQRTDALARVADSAYHPDLYQSFSIDGKEYRRVEEMSTDVVNVYQRANNPSQTMVCFCGTRTSIRGLGDILRDVQGALFYGRSHNEWLDSQTDQPNLAVGIGFQDRVANYMASAEGLALKEYLDDRKNRSNTVHVFGHSLGGAASSIFSYYLCEYMAEEGFSSLSNHIYNFAFNSPQSVGANFQNAISAEASKNAQDGFLTPFSFNVGRDPVSTWAAPYLNAAVVNEGGDRSRSLEFPPVVDRPAAMENHLLDGGYLERIGDSTYWPTGAAAAMAPRYLPGCL